MIKVYICDDEQIWIDKAKEIIKGLTMDDSDFEIHTYTNATALINIITVRKEFADIIILDIDMPGINGFETAAKLKEACPDVILMFYTSHEQYVFESFQFQPFRYIRKANAEEELRRAFSAANKVIANRIKNSIMLKTADESYIINVQNIMYFEIVKRRCDVYISDGRVLNVRKTLKELLAEINDPNFVMIHTGAAVNVRYITNYSQFDVTLENGTRLITSRNKLNDLKDAVMKYWRNQL